MWRIMAAPSWLWVPQLFLYLVFPSSAALLVETLEQVRGGGGLSWELREEERYEGSFIVSVCLVLAGLWLLCRAHAKWVRSSRFLRFPDGYGTAGPLLLRKKQEDYFRVSQFELTWSVYNLYPGSSSPAWGDPTYTPDLPAFFSTFAYGENDARLRAGSLTKYVL